MEAPVKRANWLSGLLSQVRRRRPWAIAIAVGLCAFIVPALAHTRTPRAAKKQVTAADILEQAASAAPPHGAVREVFSLEVHSGEGKTIAVAQVDSLRSADRPLKTLRLRTVGGDVLASHWIDVTGKARDFSNPSKSKPKGVAHAISVKDKVWQHPPDTADFEQLGGNHKDLALREVPDGYEVSFERPATPEKDSIIEGRPVIANATMRPVAETLRVQDGNETREYHFEELRYEVLRAEPQIDAAETVVHRGAQQVPSLRRLIRASLRQHQNANLHHGRI